MRQISVIYTMLEMKQVSDPQGVMDLFLVDSGGCVQGRSQGEQRERLLPTFSVKKC